MQPKLVLARLPIRVKLTLGYSAVFALMVALIGMFLYQHFKSGIDAGLNGTLRARADDVSTLLRQEGVRGLAARRDLLAGGELVAQVLSPEGRVLVASSPRGGRPFVAARLAKPSGDRFIDRKERERFLLRRVPVAGAPVLVVEASLDQHERALELLNGALLIGGALTLVVAGLAGYGLAGAVLRPVDAMRRAAARISDVEPHARLPLPLADDEVHRLGATLNDMLGRLEGARERERAFVSDASHELRTPLSVIRTEVEVALRTDNPPEALREALRISGEEADRLSQLAEDLLLVARSDAGRMDLDIRPVAARPLLEDITRRFRVRARENDRGLAVDAPDDAIVAADRPRVEQALSNLVDNALRHGAGTITLSAVTADGQVELHVTDEGDGFPATFVPHAFERFTRANRGRTGEGSGLGLAIVELIATAHGGQAGVADRRGRSGADVWMRLPAP